MNARQIAGLVLAAGFSDPVRGTAVVLGESGGDWSAVSPPNTDGTTDHGGWQINSNHFPGGKYDRGLIDKAGAHDPVRSTTFALGLSGGGRDYSPWSATRRSSFPGHLDTARKAIADERANPSSSPSSAKPAGWKNPIPDWVWSPGAALDGIGGLLPDLPDIPNPLEPLAKVGEIFARIGAALLDPKFWLRVAMFSAGVGVVTVGIIVWRRREIGSALSAVPHPAAKGAGVALAASAGSEAKDAAETAEKVESNA